MTEPSAAALSHAVTLHKADPLAGVLASFFAPKPELWARFKSHKAGSTASVDHQIWADFLAEYRVLPEDGVARVKYSSVTNVAKQGLDRYVADLASVAVDQLDRDEQYCFWVNLYNAMTVQLILKHFPVPSITKIKTSLLSPGPWKDTKVKVGGENVSLDAIEHRILRPIFQDARTHYALNCASISCPDLAATAFTPANKEQLLEDNAAAYVNHPRGVTVEQGRLYVSSIYSWFKSDFGGSDTSVIDHLKKYAAPFVASQLAGQTRIINHGYDWALNGG